MKKEKMHHFIETSALTGQNVNEVFSIITKHLYIENKDRLDNFVRR